MRLSPPFERIFAFTRAVGMACQPGSGAGHTVSASLDRSHFSTANRKPQLAGEQPTPSGIPSHSSNGLAVSKATNENGQPVMRQKPLLAVIAATTCQQTDGRTAARLVIICWLICLYRLKSKYFLHAFVTSFRENPLPSPVPWDGVSIWFRGRSHRSESCRLTGPERIFPTANRKTTTCRRTTHAVRDTIKFLRTGWPSQRPPMRKASPLRYSKAKLTICRCCSHHKTPG